MALKDAYNAELARRGEPEVDKVTPEQEALGRLRAFAATLPADLEAMRITPSEVEMFERELRVDTGPLMMTVRATSAGGYRLTYELKSPGKYAEHDVGPTDTLDQLEAAMARLLAEHR